MVQEQNLPEIRKHVEGDALPPVQLQQFCITTCVMFYGIVDSDTTKTGEVLVVPAN
jgi:hypothetical protein